LDLTVGVGVDTGEVLVGALASLEGPVLSIVGGVVGASDTVVDVLAVVCSMSASRVANLETENVAAHEVVPLDDLLVTVVATAREGSGVEEATKGVTTEVGAMGVKLSSEVIGLEVDAPLVNETDDLNVVGGLHELNTPEHASGDETRAMAGLGTPGNFRLFRVGDGGGTSWRCPETEV
jgi:hypothetical protein